MCLPDANGALHWGSHRMSPGGWLVRLEVRDFCHTLLRRTHESAIDRQRRQKRVVHEPLALLLRVPDDRNQVATRGRSRHVRGLFLWELVGWMYCAEHRLILLFRTTRPKMRLQIRHRP